MGLGARSPGLEARFGLSFFTLSSHVKPMLGENYYLKIEERPGNLKLYSEIHLV